jgi:hypothetical protein
MRVETTMIRADEQHLQSRSMQQGIGRHNPNFVLSLAPIFASGLNHMSLVLPHRSMCCWEDDVSSCRNSDSTTPSRGPALSVEEILLSWMSIVVLHRCPTYQTSDMYKVTWAVVISLPGRTSQFSSPFHCHSLQFSFPESPCHLLKRHPFYSLMRIDPLNQSFMHHQNLRLPTHLRVD